MQFSRLEFIFEPARSKRANSEVNQCVVIGERASYRESDKSIQNKEANLRSNSYIKPAWCHSLDSCSGFTAHI